MPSSCKPDRANLLMKDEPYRGRECRLCESSRFLLLVAFECMWLRNRFAQQDICVARCRVSTAPRSGLVKLAAHINAIDKLQAGKDFTCFLDLEFSWYT